MAYLKSPWRAGAVLGAAVIAMTAATGAAAQSPMLDYESSAKAAQVQQNAAWRLAFRPTLSVLQQTVSQLKSAPGVSPEAVQRAGDLLTQAAREDEPDARRTLWRAVALLTGRAWTDDEALLGALALRTSTLIWSGDLGPLDLQTLYPTASAGPATYKVDLYAVEPTTSATPKKGALIAAVASGRLDDGASKSIPIDLTGLADGAYLLVATVSSGDAGGVELAQPIYRVRDVEPRYSALKADLAAIEGHEAAKWTAEYPYALALAMQAGTREVVSYDFPAGMQRSAEIAAALKAGKDPVWQARGLQNRAYSFPETGELIPYQIYVPTTWRHGAHLPMVVALHGANLDETNMLGRDGAEMQKLAEAHGFIVAAPLGYRLNSAYGSQRGLARAIGSPEDDRIRRSEEDVLLVADLVQKEYGVDPARRYLTGNSMGGGGTWWIGGRHPERWAAIAPAAYGGVLPEDVAALSKTPILAVVGDHDEIGMLERVRASVETLRAGGVQPEYIEVKGGTHAGAFDQTLPQIFDFFQKHAK